MSTTRSKKKPIGRASKRRTPGTPSTPGSPGAAGPTHTDRLRKAVLREIGQRIATTKILASLPPSAGKNTPNESAQFVNGHKPNAPTTSDGRAESQNTPRGHSEQGEPGKFKPSTPKRPGTSKNGKSTKPTSPKPPSPAKGQGSSKAPSASSGSAHSPHAKWQMDREDKFFKVGQRLAREDARARQRSEQRRSHKPSSTERAKHDRSSAASSKNDHATRKPTPPKAKTPTRLSALDAAAQLLAAIKKPMRAAELIDLMAAKNLWKSPNGKTPSATLSAAITREIAAKGKNARFQKVDRGMFMARTQGKAS